MEFSNLYAKAGLFEGLPSPSMLARLFSPVCGGGISVLGRLRRASM